MSLRNTVIGCCLTLCLLGSSAAIAQTTSPSQRTADQKIRVLILTGNSDWSHPWQGTAPFLQGILNNTGRFDVKLEEEVRGITAETLSHYDVLVDYYYGPRWGDGTEKAVEDFIRSGKGMVAIHGVLYGPFFGQAGGTPTEPRRLEGEPWQAFTDMVGMTWDINNIGHAKRHVFVVQWVDRDSPVDKGLPPTFVANDELYHKIDLKPTAHVLASAFDDPNNPGGTGKTEPAVWTVNYGQGRVMVTVLGHDLLAMTQPGFMDLLARGTEWAATGSVAPGASSLAPSTSLQAPGAKH
ncbi:ThuA domain-containing protein [Paracidobacterium acidisoli]|uniref:ThuA domain-containing protein n=1 Tax=Paracidobacterium acidisoli TaxID=2303751 RepID=A0A372ILZ9_9BACT|nr:ThuA domain-containing protein [Paracidobacterium acidisoli]MBT9332374.1 ThuA domain-containing protein [Paracidobacterium acidisoli]